MRTIKVTKIGRDANSESMKYRVEIAGTDQRTFEVRLPLTAVATKPALEEEIKKLFARGWLPDDGAVYVLGNIGW
jgi:hypothetical protein